MQFFGFLKRFIIIEILIYMLVVCVCFAQETDRREEEPPKLYARAAALMDGENGRILYALNGDEFLPNASTTKILTAILVLTNCELDEKVMISEHAATRPKVRLGMKAGEEYRVEDLLYAMLLKSCNDCASALAEHVAGSEEAFSKLLNEKARAIGCKNTFFITPNGLDAELDGKTHGTTAEELAEIARYALQNETFRKIIQTKQYSFCDCGGKNHKTVNNTDKFLSLSEHAIGMKTGYTGKAGYCFVGAATYEDRLLISVVLGSGWPPNKSYKWKDTMALMQYGENCYAPQNIYREQDTYLQVTDGVDECVKIKQERKQIELLLNAQDDVKVVTDLPKALHAPIAKGQIVGRVKYYVNDELYDVTNLYAEKEIEAFDMAYCWKKIANRFFEKVAIR